MLTGSLHVDRLHFIGCHRYKEQNIRCSIELEFPVGIFLSINISHAIFRQIYTKKVFDAYLKFNILGKSQYDNKLSEHK
jgi:hypothetical protein